WRTGAFSTWSRESRRRSGAPWPPWDIASRTWPRQTTAATRRWRAIPSPGFSPAPPRAGRTAARWGTERRSTGGRSPLLVHFGGWLVLADPGVISVPVVPVPIGVSVGVPPPRVIAP